VIKNKKSGPVKKFGFYNPDGSKSMHLDLFRGDWLSSARLTYRRFRPSQEAKIMTVVLHTKIASFLFFLNTLCIGLVIADGPCPTA
jgi:hypothetical protein